MRPFEIGVSVAALPMLLWCLAHPGLPDWVRAVAGMALAVMIAHLAVEGWRWQLGLAYLLIPYLFLTCVWPCVPQLQPNSGVALVGIGMLATTIALMATFPAFQLPRPTGRYAIGTVTLHLVDATRQEPRTDRPDGHRELMIQIWYPAQSTGPGQPYRQVNETTFLSRHLSLAQTHAAAGVLLAAELERYPVVVFAPSWGGGRADNVIQAEELASHGFVVVGIDHPYSSDLVVFPDGRKSRSALTTFLDYSSDESLAATEQNAGAELRTRVADVRFVLDELERLDKSDPSGLLTARLEASRTGVFGHSFGGAVSVEVCRIDPRVLAGANLDGLIFGRLERPGSESRFYSFRTTPLSLQPQRLIISGPHFGGGGHTSQTTIGVFDVA